MSRRRCRLLPGASAAHPSRRGGDGTPALGSRASLPGSKHGDSTEVSPRQRPPPGSKHGETTPPRPCFWSTRDKGETTTSRPLARAHPIPSLSFLSRFPPLVLVLVLSLSAHAFPPAVAAASGLPGPTLESAGAEQKGESMRMGQTGKRVESKGEGSLHLASEAAQSQPWHSSHISPTEPTMRKAAVELYGPGQRPYGQGKRPYMSVLERQPRSQQGGKEGGSPGQGSEGNAELARRRLARKLPGGFLFSQRELMRCDQGQALPFSVASVGPAADSSAWRNKSLGAQVLRDRRFWAFARTTEQLTKGILHVLEAAQFAKKFNRTFVIPNVRSSYLRAFERHHPCLYLDTASLSAAVGDWVSIRYLNWVLQELGSPGNISVAHALLLDTNRHCPGIGKRWPPESKKPLGSALSQLSLFCFRDTHRPASRDLPALEQFVATQVLRGEGGADSTGMAPLPPSPSRVPPLLVAEYKYSASYYLPWDELQSLRDQVSFAPHLHRAVNTLVTSKLGSSPNKRWVAVHWRLELTVFQWQRRMRGEEGGRKGAEPPLAEHMLACARGLIKALFAMQEGPDRYAWFFLASDMMGDGTPSSSTIHRLTEDEVAVAADIRTTLEEALAPVTWRSVVSDYQRLDSGVQGILDMLVCLNATLFLRPPPACGGNRSSFGNRINRMRGDRQNMKWGLDGNIV